MDKGATDRCHLADVIGENFSRKCHKCKYRNDMHVNFVYAKYGHIIGVAYSIGLVLIFSGIYIFMLQFEGKGLGFILICAILSIMLICKVIHEHEADNIKNFNAYKM